jgi:hypothetical protein
MNYQIVSVVFYREHDKHIWLKHKEAFEKSVKQNTQADLIILEPEVPRDKAGYKFMFSANAYKLRIWRDIIRQAVTPVVLADIDLIFLKDPAPVLEESGYDIGICKRPTRNKIWFNGGVVFVKPTDEACKFMDAWVEKSDYFYENPVEFNKALKRHYGLNQTSFIHLLDGEYPGTIKEFPSAIWNNCDPQTWRTVNEETAVIHVKGSLEAGLFNKKMSPRYAAAYRKIAPYYDLSNIPAMPAGKQTGSISGQPVLERKMQQRFDRIPSWLRPTQGDIFR